MILQQCDICGRIENSMCLNKDKDNKKYKLAFSSDPLRLTIKNFSNQPYNVYLDIGAQKQSDTKKLKSLYNTVKNLRTIDSCADESNIQEMIALKMDNPFPAICNDCKKKLIIRILSEDETEFNSF